MPRKFYFQTPSKIGGITPVSVHNGEWLIIKLVDGDKAKLNDVVLQQGQKPSLLCAEFGMLERECRKATLHKFFIEANHGPDGNIKGIGRRGEKLFKGFTADCRILSKDQ